MRFAAMTKSLGVALVTGAVLSASPVLADPECRPACETTYTEDQQACLDTYNQTLADLQVREAACLALPEDQQSSCLKDVERERKQAKGPYKNCLAKARVDYNHCIQACFVSPSQP